jgi:tripartite-type tricarboxylate transporter receptor subunit TctC
MSLGVFNLEVKMIRILIKTLTAIGFLMGAAQAQEQITLVVPFSAGGPTDQVTRVLAEGLTKVTGKRYVVDNKPGAAGIVAAQYVARAPSDGSVYMVGSPASLVINIGLYKKLSYNPEKDFIPVAGMTRSPLVLVTNPKVSANDIKGLIETAKQNKQSLPMGSPGSGTIPHLAGAYLSSQLGIEVLHVPYKGIAPAIAGLIAGDIVLVFDTLSTAIPNIQSGQLKALGIASDKRNASLSNIPTLSEQGYPLQASSWFGLMAPVNTPESVVQNMNAAVNQVITSDDFKQRLLQNGSEALTGSPDDFARFIQSERERWLPEIKRLNLSAD